MEALDTRVSTALTQLHALETALHAPSFSSWEMEVGEVRSQAVRVRSDRGVYFEAPFDEVPERAVMTLYCNGQPLLARPFRRPRAFVDALGWELSLGEVLARR